MSSLLCTHPPTPAASATRIPALQSKQREVRGHATLNRCHALASAVEPDQRLPRRWSAWRAPLCRPDGVCTRALASTAVEQPPSHDARPPGTHDGTPLDVPLTPARSVPDLDADRIVVLSDSSDAETDADAALRSSSDAAAGPMGSDAARPWSATPLSQGAASGALQALPSVRSLAETARAAAAGGIAVGDADSGASDRTEAAAHAASSADATADGSGDVPSASRADGAATGDDAFGAGERGGGRGKPPKPPPPMPTLIPPPSLPSKDDPVWENAAFLIDKPQHWTSSDVCGRLKGQLDLKKVGHTGTLDPLATGLLIICIGKGCKSVEKIQAEDKLYTGTLRLGERTPSFDAETAVSETAPWEHLSDADLQAAVDHNFLGDISQLPPMYSAVKVNGVRLYDAARLSEEEGEEVAEIKLELRNVSVSQFRVWREDAASQDVQYRIRCSKGTYVRSLIDDLGRQVGSCAHVRTLRREASGSYNVADAWRLEDLLADAESKGMRRRPKKGSQKRKKPSSKPDSPENFEYAAGRAQFAAASAESV